MKKLIGEHVYSKNGARISIFAVHNLPGVPACDTMLLEAQPGKNGGELQAFYLRPDEALLLIRLLADGVNRTTQAYLFGLQRKGKGGY